MLHDESSINNDIKGLKELQQLDQVFSQIIGTLEKSRANIFEINHTCEAQCLHLETEMRELNHKINKIIQEEEKCRKQERLARLHLMEVSKHFNIATEDDIKRAYH
ncbi:MAG: hypothetical protein WBJ34_06715, partial [Syntrophomonadaceae bacterium]